MSCVARRPAVTGAGRFWYLVDHEAGIVWLVHAGTGHPTATDR